MTVAVLLDGPGLGMTEGDYTSMRERDGKVFLGLGGADGELWESIPHYSLDMNGAYLVLCEVAKKWSSLARGRFWSSLQERAGLDPVIFSLPEWPHALFCLIDELPVHVCEAFLIASQWYANHGRSPYDSSERAAVFKDRLEVGYRLEVDEEGIEHTRMDVKPPNGTPPWVKYVANESV